MSIGYFSRLGIIICAVFIDLGQYSSRRMAFNIYIRLTSSSCGISCSILAVIRSRLCAFFGSSCSILAVIRSRLCAFFGTSCSILAGIRSIPGAFLVVHVAFWQ